MYFWKIDEETIRCLINKDEINQMGFDMNSLSQSEDEMEEFLQAIMRNSQKYVSWNTENGLQTYMARTLPSDQVLLTLSCTFKDVAIDRDLDQIRHMRNSLTGKITDQRLDHIYSLSGEEKESAFEELAKDLHNVCMGNIDDDETAKNQDRYEDSLVSGTGSAGKGRTGEGKQIPPYKLVFPEMRRLVQFCSLLDSVFFMPSVLFKERDQYVLLAEFPEELDKKSVISFLITAEEYGARCSIQKHDRAYYSEHGKRIIDKDAIAVLASLGN